MTRRSRLLLVVLYFGSALALAALGHPTQALICVAACSLILVAHSA